MFTVIRDSINLKIEDIEYQLEDAIRYQRSSLVGQLLAYYDVLKLMDNIEKISKDEKIS